MWQFLHNPRCRKSREALALLEQAGKEVEIRLYLEDSLAKDELRVLLRKLGMKAEDLVRKKEPLLKDLGIDIKALTDEEWLELMVSYPKLIERPILIGDKRAVLGRPPEHVLTYFA